MEIAAAAEAGEKTAAVEEAGERTAAVEEAGGRIAAAVEVDSVGASTSEGAAGRIAVGRWQRN